MLLHHARRPARTRTDGSLVPLAEQDRSLWDTRLIAEGVDVLQAALARDRLGEFQAQGAIAALHADAHTVEETDWVQIVEWYDELLRLTDNPVARLNRAVGEADGPRAGLAALAELDPALPRHTTAAAAYLHERDGDPVTAARLYAEAARNTIRGSTGRVGQLGHGRFEDSARRDGVPGCANRAEGREKDVTDHYPRHVVAVTAIVFDAAGRVLLVEG
jgi:predicted RNA polymerase sigma factor